MSETYCKECNTPFRHCEKASEMYNSINVVKKDFFMCRCGRTIDEMRNPLGVNYK